ncbi:winged helix-turn-helix transcriptional regulator [Sinomicrobium oceani]|uniref:winged helix-turn-helix transcriptional regulator n=1 Tax=Sinomicrobium oceani TaxID=1150368 RepID=UPI00227A74A9|nr:helix-turn-helix domain-containing protein [Sinomicrobium oceani]
METKELTTEEKNCPLEKAVRAISGKWKIAIIWQIGKGEKRPSEFLRSIGKADRRVLSQQLSEMVTDGLLIKTAYNELPPRVEYTLTPKGEDLVKILWELNEWGKQLHD